MAEISAKDVAALRKATGAGMMDCKNALEESEGDLERAMDRLREKGLGKAGKLSDREATEGAVEAIVDGNVGVIVELNCNTDFVAKGAEFTGTVSAIAKLVAAEGDADVAVAAVRGLDGGRDAHAARREAGRERVARPGGSLRGDRRPRRRVHAHAEQPRHDRRARRARRGRPVRRAAHGKSRTRSRCTSRSPRPAISRATRFPPTSSSASGR